jgi:signal transduction histidine kinase
VLTAAIERGAVEAQLAQKHREAERLAELDRLRRIFIATISHNLRTPLTALQSGLGMLEASSRERLRPAEHKLLANAQRSVERLAVDINDLLTAQQLEAGVLHAA